MAVKLEGSIKRYIGLSSDPKPFLGFQQDGTTTTDYDLPPGSSFLESDTGYLYRWTGTAWSRPGGEDSHLALLELIYAELHELRELKEMELEA